MEVAERLGHGELLPAHLVGGGWEPLRAHPRDESVALSGAAGHGRAAAGHGRAAASGELLLAQHAVDLFPQEPLEPQLLLGVDLGEGLSRGGERASAPLWRPGHLTRSLAREGGLLCGEALHHPSAVGARRLPALVALARGRIGGAGELLRVLGALLGERLSRHARMLPQRAERLPDERA